MTEKIKMLKIIHLAISAGLIVVYVIFGDLFSFDYLKLPTVDSSSIVYLLIPILAVISGNLLFKSQLKSVDPKLPIEDKLTVYQTASIMRWAILEVAAFLILFLKPDFLIFGILIIIYLFLIRPTEKQIKKDFETLN
ncbi:MAG: MFS transporter [Brumimicrobium sp.]